MTEILSEFGHLIGTSKPIQVNPMPAYIDYNLNDIVQYIGPTDNNYINGYFYKRGASGWEQANVQPAADVSGKADKVTSATDGNLAKLDSNGNLADSGKSAAKVVEATSGTLDAKLVANATAVATLSDAQVRNISIGTSDLTPGTSALATGSVYFVYEA